MKMLTHPMVNMLPYIVLIFTIPITVQAQKLPNVQETSLRAPANIKIDGKASEWGPKFQAHNHATDIYYTMANDDENLYLVIKASDPDVLTKITNRGVVFTINTSVIKKDENAASITYPIFDMGNKPYIRFTNMTMLRSQREAIEQNPDSVSKIANKKLYDNEKYIRTKGISGVDTLLSIYNREGIRAAESFDSKMVYTYELALPLKYLSISKDSKFAYHIMLPGIDMNKDSGIRTTKTDDGKSVISAAPGAVFVQGSHLPAVTSTTDFWGEYTLAKK